MNTIQNSFSFYGVADYIAESGTRHIRTGSWEEVNFDITGHQKHSHDLMLFYEVEKFAYGAGLYGVVHLNLQEILIIREKKCYLEL